MSDFSYQTLVSALAPQMQSPTPLMDGLNNGGQQFAQIIPSVPQPHNIEDGPEYNKWDEALQQYGTIRLPKERDEPQKWMNKFNDILKSNGIDREDRPDGSVILSKKALTS